MIGLLRAGIARRRGDSEQMDVLTRQARAHLSADNEALRPMADLYLAVADQLRGRTAEAERSLAAAVADQHTAADRYLAVNIACDLGRVRQAQADLDGALRAFDQELEIVTYAGLPLPLAGLAYLGMADVLYERDDMDAAERHATDGIALPQAGPDSLAPGPGPGPGPGGTIVPASRRANIPPRHALSGDVRRGPGSYRRWARPRSRPADGGRPGGPLRRSAVQRIRIAKPPARRDHPGANPCPTILVTWTWSGSRNSPAP